MKSNDLKSISDLEHGNHLCCLYETEEEQVAQLTPFILKGLGEQEKVFFHIDSLTSERLLEIWESKEPVIARAFHDGQLSLLTDRDPFTRSGAFSPDGMITSMRTLEKRALEEGFTGLRVAAEATWLFSGMTDSSLFVRAGEQAVPLPAHQPVRAPHTIRPLDIRPLFPAGRAGFPSRSGLRNRGLRQHLSRAAGGTAQAGHLLHFPAPVAGQSPGEPAGIADTP